LFCLLIFLSSQFIGLIPAQDLEHQERNLYGNTFHYGNGRSKTSIFNDFVNFFNGTDWENINPNIVISNDPLYDFMVSKGIYEAYFKASPTTSEMIKFYYNSSRKQEHPHKTGFLTLQPRALKYLNDLSQIQIINMPQAVVGLPVNNSLVYPDIYRQGINLSFSYKPSALKQHLTIQTNDSLPAPLQYIIDGGNVTLDIDFEIGLSDFLEVYIENEIWNRNKEKRINRKDIELRYENETVFSFNKVFAYDSNKSAIFGDFQIKKSQRAIILTMKIPYNFLMGENILYPVFIDPTVIIKRPSSEGFSSFFPNQFPSMESDTDYHYVDGNYTGNAWVEVGDAPFLNASNDGSYIYTKTHLAQTCNFTYENSIYPLGVTVTAILLKTRAEGDGNDEYIIHLWDGSSWHTQTFMPTSPYVWNAWDVTAILNSKAKVDGAETYFHYEKSGKTNDLFIDVSLLEIWWEQAIPHWQLVDDVTPDNASTRIWTSETDASSYRDLYNIPDYDLPLGHAIDQIEVFAFVIGGIILGDSPRMRLSIRTYDTTYNKPSGGWIQVTNDYYHNQSYAWATNQHTGNPWNETEIDALQIGLMATSSTTPFFWTLECTQVFVEITSSTAIIPSNIPVLFIGLLFFIFLVFMGFYLGLKRKQ